MCRFVYSVQVYKDRMQQSVVEIDLWDVIEPLLIGSQTVEIGRKQSCRGQDTWHNPDNTGHVGVYPVAPLLIVHTTFRRESMSPWYGCMEGWIDTMTRDTTKNAATTSLRSPQETSHAWGYAHSLEA